MLEPIRSKPESSIEKISTPSSNSWRHWEEEPGGSEELYALSLKGLWQFLLFALISTAAFCVQDFNLYAVLPESALQILGCPPPANMISIALAIYGISAFIPILISLSGGSKPTHRWQHLGYRSTFYLFYLVSNSLETHFTTVFIIGLTLYGLEQLSTWTYIIDKKFLFREGSMGGLFLLFKGYYASKNRGWRRGWVRKEDRRRKRKEPDAADAVTGRSVC
jgi:hypothetical protein